MASDLSLADLVGIVAVFVLILAVQLMGGE
jgi:hypothetical protein